MKGKHAPGHETHNALTEKTRTDGSKSADQKLGELKAKYDEANEHLKATIATKQATRLKLKEAPEDADLKAEYDKLKVQHTEALEQIRAARGAYKEYRGQVVATAPAA